LHASYYNLNYFYELTCGKYNVRSIFVMVLWRLRISWISYFHIQWVLNFLWNWNWYIFFWIPLQMLINDFTYFHCLFFYSRRINCLFILVLNIMKENITNFQCVYMNSFWSLWATLQRAFLVNNLVSLNGYIHLHLVSNNKWAFSFFMTLVKCGFKKFFTQRQWLLLIIVDHYKCNLQTKGD